ncbi:MAG: protein-L-isoaspartate(D-aspartate) O-methyltransferase [Planctomycetes bacterium]|nr:protein-L-isoaspartate(D-aspartate) O-methyltransferase [Planctomycetota bacterium]
MFDREAAQKLSRALASRGIQDQRVLTAIAETPRERFVPAELLDRAWDDTALPIGSGQTISQPFIVALMTQELRLTGEERVLEIGTGSGYQAAVLRHLCKELVTVERLRELADEARRVLEDVGCHNVEYAVGDGTLGWPTRAPYEGIIVTAAAPAIPQPLYEQLAEGGRLVIPVGDSYAQTLLRVEKTDAGRVVHEICGCRFVKLIGEAGWPSELADDDDG